jgi:DeoR/GlpR family transcriptional regulator of sugar metabolism
MVGTRNEKLLIPRQAGLNSRQLQILNILKPSDLIDTRTYSKLFKISTATANRDLRELAKHKQIIQQGRSRDIAYQLA